jgi:hypothetical protein
MLREVWWAWPLKRNGKCQWGGMQGNEWGRWDKSRVKRWRVSGRRVMLSDHELHCSTESLHWKSELWMFAFWLLHRIDPGYRRSRSYPPDISSQTAYKTWTIMTSSNLRNSSRRLGIILGCRSQAIGMPIDQGVDGRKLVMIKKLWLISLASAFYGGLIKLLSITFGT